MSNHKTNDKTFSHYFVVHFGYSLPEPQLEASFTTKESAYQWLENKQKELNAGRHPKDNNGTFIIESYEKPNFDWSLPKDGIYSLSNAYTTMDVYILYEKNIHFSLFNRTINNQDDDIEGELQECKTVL